MKGFIEVTSIIAKEEGRGKKIKSLKNVNKIINVLKIEDLDDLDGSFALEFPDANTLLEIDRNNDTSEVVCIETYEEIKAKIKEASE